MKPIVNLKNNYLIKQLPKATTYVNLNYEIIYISDSWNNQFNQNQTDLLGSNVLNTFPKLSHRWKQDFINCFLGFSNKLKNSSYYKQDVIIWLEWIIQPWYDEDENIIGAILQLENSTEKNLKNQRLETLEILLDVKSEIGKIGSWEYDALTDKVVWCKMTKLIHEVTEDYIPTTEKSINFYKPGKSKDKLVYSLKKSMNESGYWSEKLQLITAKGKEIWAIAAWRSIFENNKFIGIVGSIQDITKEVEAQAKTVENEQLLTTLIDNLPLNIYIKDLKSRKILINKAECDYIGLPAEEIVGKTDFDFYPKEIAQKSRIEDLKVINSLKPILKQEKLNIKKDGTRTHFLMSKIPLINNQNEITGIVGFSLDINYLKEKEDELRRLINITSLQNKKLVNFAHIISHNIRSHSANFSLLLGFLIKENKECERLKLLEMLTNESDNLLETLDNLNQVVEINTNLNLTNTNIEINSSIDLTLNKLKHLIKNKKAIISNTIEESIFINGIPSYVENILLTVISNAIKFSNNNTENLIQISAEQNSNQTILIIKDSGIGIDLNKNKNKLFGMYRTFHENPESKGIGLFIAKNQIEAMNGKFEVKSEIGKGTIFKIYFNEID
ncbi:PAS domain-containing sensor histidine kinase [Cellulophaga sp. HaHaR_3_176]|uniref:PAS domain-containing sensor histidine kinase n=1 Tax=Cellulophaga sp. HaHaR_3_176 TaxID=1942464 RepID=UPI001C1F82D0|nr:PAS domain-containing sensor histidine kinase [Cellulophaga sp. HaHaR_3_176]QWX84389.1 PAS domain-containing sensor histidine kinase [Cellulophaga sp. HaHaR_3_176]